MTDLDLEALREVVAKGTPGPDWQTFPSDAAGPGWGIYMPAVKQARAFIQNQEDAELIVAAVNALPVLMDEVQRLRRWKSEALEVLKGWEGVHEALDHPGELGQMKYKASVAAVHALTADRDRLRERVAELEGRCICNTSPSTDGPDETCPVHGRTYADWIERGDILQQRAEKAEAEVARLTAVVQGVKELAGSYVLNGDSPRRLMGNKVLSVLAGGTDTPKGEGE